MSGCVSVVGGEVTLEPAPGRWGEALARRPDARARRFRAQLGLDPDRPLVMGGHQAGLWHPGICAKHFAIGAMGKRGAQGVWLVVDQDDNTPTRLRVPVLDDGRLCEGIWEMAPGGRVLRGTPTGMRRPIEPAAFGGRVHPGVRADAIMRAREAIARHGRCASLAMQMACGERDLLGSLVEAYEIVPATAFARTDLFGEFVERMARDGRAMARAYNEACRRHPEAGVRPLIERPGGVEVPLWRVRPGEARLPVFDCQLGEIPLEELAPRALLMTAMARLAGCELFVHGTGGAVYDRITQAWVRTWLGEEIGPMAVASATLRLEGLARGVPDEREIQRLIARAHRARHDPAIVGDAQRARRRRELVEAIERARASGSDPAPHFRALHALIDEHRRAHADAIAAIEDEATRARDRRDAARLAHDRTWAFIFHDERALSDLRDAIAEALGGSSCA